MACETKEAKPAQIAVLFSASNESELGNVPILIEIHALHSTNYFISVKSIERTAYVNDWPVFYLHFD